MAQVGLFRSPSGPPRMRADRSSPAVIDREEHRDATSAQHAAQPVQVGVQFLEVAVAGVGQSLRRPPSNIPSAAPAASRGDEGRSTARSSASHSVAARVAMTAAAP